MKKFKIRFVTPDGERSQLVYAENIGEPFTRWEEAPWDPILRIQVTILPLRVHIARQWVTVGELVYRSRVESVVCLD